MKQLIIVESPAKAGTIKKFLGKNVNVIASKGHIRDLPKSRIGVDLEKFEPEYINVRGKGDLIKELKKAAKDVEVLLAPDPDREGEAIAWHLSKILGIDEEKVCRITFNEITKEAVTEAVKNPRKINLDLVNSQQARRVLDRIVGYKISPILWKKVKSGLSAGRVQSVALRIIIEKEEAIKNFVSEEYWNIDVVLTDEKEQFVARFYGKNGKKQKLLNKVETDKIIEETKDGKYIVKNVDKSEKKKNPTPPFTTSTLQQTASRSLNFSIKKTMQIAQSLYEGIKIPGKGTTGLITYMRTDSTRISDVARKKAEEIITEKYGKEYYENRFFKTNKSAQDGHEAIRPSYPEITPEEIEEFLSKDEYKLYKLIYNRFLASQMKAAVYDTVTAKIYNGEYEFRSSGSKIKFLGFMKVYGLTEFKKQEIEEKKEQTNEEDEIKETSNFPELSENQEVFFKKLDSIQSFTQPPVRYTEASLVKILEENGIGRPSTYAPTINTLHLRKYIKKDKKHLLPTELGEIVNNILVTKFDDIFNIKFTAVIEEEFDEVSEGNKNWKQIMQEFYKRFETLVKEAMQDVEKVEIKLEESDVICENCGRKMVYKDGRFGRFLACPGYPECKNTKKIEKFIEERCPKCGSRVEERKSKSNKKYYICEQNTNKEDRKCDYISWTKPAK